MKKGLGIMTVVVVLLAAGVAMAQPPMPAGPFNILHKDGAIYSSNTGWNLSIPPYYAGTGWAVDFTYTSEGVSILHQDGAIWNATTGWNMSSPPFYAGSGYSRSLEYVRDLTGCWGVEWMEWFTALDQDGINFDMEKNLRIYPYMFVQITQQIGTRLYGQAVIYNPVGPLGPECQYHPFEGTVIGDHVTIFVGEYGHCVPTGGEPPYDTERYKLTLVGLVFWDDELGEWLIKGSFVGSELPEMYEQLDCTEVGRWGVFNMWPEVECICPLPF